MAHVTLQQALQTALAHHQAGRLDAAERLYRHILAQQPRQPEALHLLGIIAQQTGRHAMAVDLIRQAIAVQPQAPEAYSNLGNALKDLGQLDAASAAFRQALALRPDNPEVYSNLGNVLRDQGQLDAALVACRQAIALDPALPEAHNNLGNALKDLGQLDAASAAFRRAIALKPRYPAAHSNLGGALKDQGRLDEAIAAYRQAIALDPDYAEAHSNLGGALKDQGQLDAAIAAYRQALARKSTPAHGTGPANGAPHNPAPANELDAAPRQRLDLAPNLAAAHSNLLLTLNYHPATTPESLLQEARRWAQEYAAPLHAHIRPPANDRHPDRRLRIGYVSPDLREHVATRFLLPLLRHHDHQQFAIFAYANVAAPDGMTQRLRAHTDAWRNIVGLTDAAAAELIRGDAIDILMDLSGHSAQHRLRLFAHRPAPVQATWLGYPGTTGLETMDYRFTDVFLDPPAVPETYCTEQLVRLPRTVSCYGPSLPGPALTAPPALATGHITFGCLNNPCKVSEPTLALWVRILQALPQARLLMFAHAGAHRQRVQQRLAQAGLDSQRVRFVGYGGPRYLEFYRDIDIVLDPFPYTGSTTTCDALWMGVPVVTLTGATIVSRLSMALLTNVGRTGWIAHSPDQYCAHAVALAADLPHLVELRRTLRTELEQSPLMDAPGFARDMEAAYRQIWQTWCAAAPGPGA